MRDRSLLLLGATLVLAACAREPVGPVAPIAPAQVTPAPALDASAARQTVVEFVEAYRASPQQGVGPLTDLVAGPDLASWVRWLDVQNREFDGQIDAIADVRDVEFVGALSTRRASGASVGLSASVLFTFDPTNDAPIDLVRVLDGPVTLVRTAPGSYRVVDLLRNGVPMTDSIAPLGKQRRTVGDVTVRLDSLFMFPPNWQFNVIVENRSAKDIVLDTSGGALFIDRPEGFERVDGVITPSLTTVPAGAIVEGLMVFPAQNTADGRVLSLLYGGKHLRFQFPLDGLVTAVPPPPPTDGGTVVVSPN